MARRQENLMNEYILEDQLDQVRIAMEQQLPEDEREAFRQKGTLKPTIPIK